MSCWLLLRGLARESRHWEGFVEIFRASNPGDEIRTLDLAGNGARNNESSPPSIHEMVEDYRCLLGATINDGPFRILALSMGGMVALEWGIRYPHEIDRCVLINSSLGGLSAFHKRLRPVQYCNLMRLALATSGESAEAIILAMTSISGDPQLAKKWATYRLERPISTRNMWRQLLAAARYRCASSAFSVPCLLLASTRDRLVDVACSRATAKQLGVPLIEHATAGHDLPLDAPHWVAEQVRGWIDTTDGDG